ncbi:AAA family ATPase [Pseudaestuariivita sp.]|uniref:AAA family ATPase n=1 Tax=Pseudaestuariivita sp. TaxID=2211669 RepID=UPI004057DD20
MQFKSISLAEWRQFKDVEIKLHPRLTILTGPNGSGKSTLLSLLNLSTVSPHEEPFLATPVSDKKSGRSGFSIGTLFARFNPFKKSTTNGPEEDRHSIGLLTYASGDHASLEVIGNSDLQYQININGRVAIPGFKIASHRALPRYQAVKNLPVSGIKPKEAFDYFAQSSSSYQRGGRLHRDGRNVENPIAPLKETLIGFAAFGADNAHMKAVPELVGLYNEFQETLGTLLPTEIGFQTLEVRSPEIVVVTKTGEFPIDSASGGLMALIQTAWQIFLFTKANGEDAVVLIDEPENHLHPSLQRDFLSNLVRTFSQTQFVVATHSPFIISSVKDSFIYALRYVTLSNDASAVTAQLVELESKAGSASKILDEVLGVSVTIPAWAEEELDAISERFEKSTLSEQSIKNLREELREAGLSQFFPEAVGRIARD